MRPRYFVLAMIAVFLACKLRPVRRSDRRGLLAAPTKPPVVDLHTRAVILTRALVRIFGPTKANAVCFTPEYPLRGGDTAQEVRRPASAQALAHAIGAELGAVGDVWILAPKYSRAKSPEALHRLMLTYPHLEILRFVLGLDGDTWRQCYPSRWAPCSKAVCRVAVAVHPTDKATYGPLLRGLPERELAQLEFSVVPSFRVSIRYRGRGVGLEHCLWQRYRYTKQGQSPPAASRSGSRSSKVASVSLIDAHGSSESPASEQPLAFFQDAKRVTVARSPLNLAEVCGMLAHATGRDVRPSRTIRGLWACLTPGEYEAKQLAAAVAEALELEWRAFRGGKLLFLADDAFNAASRRIHARHDARILDVWRHGVLPKRIFENAEVKQALDPFLPADFVRFEAIPFGKLSEPQQALALRFLLADTGESIADEQRRQLSVVCLPDVGLFFRRKGGLWSGSTPNTMLYRLLPPPVKP